uniref:Uncharacterized protein n=1 Tax=Chromera velia CCMP2878 TaxID=1169474 RepID=A0A0G4HH34_9ALVE|eukprot:Cvel_27535.t1-p1 / transcript=Cvel_27535.t1 / gene=Cvel_27535 / organism=Chromera_velia_CCMP2878 / gene_product=Ribonuclease inhibitor, putative / transcript_product=Ribonuclease inhibitor, putative / location=Cvel_scaffold3454:1494-3357(+) / protein_length=214 / sequence_SO=supercontig / SO=protein_coding / is_pseudo=false
MNSVEFGCNNFDNGAVAAIAETLRRDESLQHLAIWGNSVGDSGAASLADLVASCPLVSLVLSNNEMSDNGLSSLAQALPACPSLRTLDLSVNAHIADTGVQSLCRALRSEGGPRVEVLTLNNCSVGNEGARHLATLLTEPECPLRELDLAFNMIEDPGAKVLASALEVNSVLVELNVSVNLFSRTGISLLMQALARKHVPGRQILIEDVPYAGR